MLQDLVGKAVLITGSSTGIGAAVARGFASCGARVAVHCNESRDSAEQLVSDIIQLSGEAVLVSGDIASSTATADLVREAARKLRGLDILVNNAGGLLKRASLVDIDDALYERVTDLNIRSVVAACRTAVPLMIERGGGSIISTTSVAARNGGNPGASIYAASKAFVSTFTRNLAKELAETNIRVNAVSPGVISTRFHERYSTAESLEAMRKTIPLGRLGRVEDCVGAYLFLASSAMSGFITGQIIEVNGGQLMP